KHGAFGSRADGNCVSSVIARRSSGGQGIAYGSQSQVLECSPCATAVKMAGFFAMARAYNRQPAIGWEGVQENDNEQGQVWAGARRGDFWLGSRRLRRWQRWR